MPPVAGSQVAVVAADELIEGERRLACSRRCVGSLVALVLGPCDHVVGIRGRGVCRVVLADPQPVERDVAHALQEILGVVQAAIGGDVPGLALGPEGPDVEAGNVGVQLVHGVAVVGTPAIHFREARPPVDGPKHLDAAIGEAVGIDDRGIDRAPVAVGDGPHGDPGGTGIVAAVQCVAAARLKDGVEARRTRFRTGQLAARGRREHPDRRPGLPVVHALLELRSRESEELASPRSRSPQIARERPPGVHLLESREAVIGAQHLVLAPDAREHEHGMGPVAHGQDATHAVHIPGDPGRDAPGLAEVAADVNQPAVGRREHDIRVPGRRAGDGGHPMRSAVQVVPQGLPPGSVQVAEPEPALAGPGEELCAVAGGHGHMHATRLVVASALDPRAQPGGLGSAGLRQSIALRDLRQSVSALDRLPIHLGRSLVKLAEPGFARFLLRGFRVVGETILRRRGQEGELRERLGGRRGLRATGAESPDSEERNGDSEKRLHEGCRFGR